MSKKENKKQTYPEIKNFKELVERYKEYDSKVAFKFKQKGKVIDITYNKFSDDVSSIFFHSSLSFYLFTEVQL